MPYQYEHPHPAVTVDIVVFDIRDDNLNVLLIKRAQEPFVGRWALPGGFVDIDESLDAAARRELREETGVEAAYLEQFHAFGEPGRDPRERVISIAFCALLAPDAGEVNAASDAADARWFGIDNLPELAFDHADIVNMALERLADMLDDPANSQQ